MNPVLQHLDTALQKRMQQGNLRSLQTAHAGIDLFSNDYLGFATQGILYKVLQGKESHQTGSTGSRLLSGNSKEIEELEQIIAQFHGADAALIFNSGYDANVGLLSSIASRHTIFIYDELCHASIIDGISLARCHHKYKFKHNNLSELEALLQDNKGRELVVVVESIYSMDGDAAPLQKICELTEQYSAALIVDEAHATGVIGKKGEGLVTTIGLEEKVFARVHTFGKALGCHGAAVFGSKQLREYMVNFARPFIYSTALSPHAINSIGSAYEILSSPDFSNESLHQLVSYFKKAGITLNKGNWVESNSPIQALIVGGNDETKRLAKKAQEAGLQVNAILSPTVAEGEERLRICLHTFNTKEEIDILMHVLNRVDE